MSQSRSQSTNGRAATVVAENPLLDLDFRIPFDRIRVEHVEPAIDALIERSQAAIDRIADGTDEPTYANTLGALEEACTALELAMSVVGHLEAVRTTPELRDVYNLVQPRVSAFYSAIPTNADLWAALRAFEATGEATRLDATRARLLEKTIQEFRRHGAELSDEGKAELGRLDVELSQVTSRFAQNTLDATNQWELLIADEAQLAGLPASAVDAARESAASRGLDGWRLTLQGPSFIAALTFLDDASLREQIWRASSTRATRGELDNRPLIARILELRKQRARLLGFDDFTDLVLEDRMAKRGATAAQFLVEMRARCESAAAKEHETLLAFRRSLEGDDAPELQGWDVAYYAEKQRAALYDFDEEQLRPYFSAEGVLAGLFEIVQRLYGIRVEEHDMPTWHESVRTFAIRDADGRHAASFYVDLYPRDDKRGGAWMRPFLSSVPTGDGQPPHLGLFCANVNAPIGDKPALLSHRDVETLFHEFGHLMHHCASRVTVRSLAGTNVAWDFVELPSQIMENWCWERGALDLFAKHWETGETIPDELFDRMLRARTYRAASMMMRQLGFATTDLRMHREYDAERDGDIIAYAREALTAFTPTRMPSDYAMIASFTHLFASPVAYAGGYYSYLWAEVLEADAFSRFKQAGVFDAEVGRAFLELLSKGDSEDPMDLFVAFMGREPRVDALLERAGLA